MSILRIIGALMIAFSGAFAAYFLNRDAKETLSQTECFISLVRFLRAQIECFSMSVPKALDRVPDEMFSGCGFSGEERPQSMGEFLDGCRVTDDAVMRDMRRLAEDLGKGYREEQLTLCDYCLSLLEGQRARIAGQLPLKIKVNSVLSLAGAAAVVILLI